jgi:hypothetical protein
MASMCSNNDSGHSCTYTVTRKVEVQGCPVLVDKAGEVVRGAKPLEQKLLGPSPNEANILEKGLGCKAPATLCFGKGNGWHCLGVSRRGLVPEVAEPGG